LRLSSSPAIDAVSHGLPPPSATIPAKQMTSPETGRGVAAAFRWGSASSEDSDQRRFQQQRVLLLAKLLVIFFGSIHLLSFVIIGVAEPGRVMAIQFPPAKVLAYLLVLIWAAIWLVLRRKDQPPAVIHLCDLGTVLPLSLSICVGIRQVPPLFSIEIAA